MQRIASWLSGCKCKILWADKHFFNFVLADNQPAILCSHYIDTYQHSGLNITLDQHTNMGALKREILLFHCIKLVQDKPSKKSSQRSSGLYTSALQAMFAVQHKNYRLESHGRPVVLYIPPETPNMRVGFEIISGL